MDRTNNVYLFLCSPIKGHEEVCEKCRTACAYIGVSKTSFSEFQTVSWAGLVLMNGAHCLFVCKYMCVVDVYVSSFSQIFFNIFIVVRTFNMRSKPLKNFKGTISIVNDRHDIVLQISQRYLSCITELYTHQLATLHFSFPHQSQTRHPPTLCFHEFDNVICLISGITH